MSLGGIAGRHVWRQDELGNQLAPWFPIFPDGGAVVFLALRVTLWMGVEEGGAEEHIHGHAHAPAHTHLIVFSFFLADKPCPLPVWTPIAGSTCALAQSGAPMAPPHGPKWWTSGKQGSLSPKL